MRCLHRNDSAPFLIPEHVEDNMACSSVTEIALKPGCGLFSSILITQHSRAGHQQLEKMQTKVKIVIQLEKHIDIIRLNDVGEEYSRLIAFGAIPTSRETEGRLRDCICECLESESRPFRDIVELTPEYLLTVAIELCVNVWDGKLRLLPLRLLGMIRMTQRW